MTDRNFRRRFNRPFFAVFCALLTAAHLLLILAFVKNASPTWDEPVHLCGGVNMLLNRDFRVNPESGVFPQIWAALPAALTQRENFPGVNSPWFTLDQWVFSYKIIYEQIRDYGRLYQDARMMTGLLSAVLGLLIAMRAKRHFGAVAALIILAFYSFWPVFISNGGLVTSDTAVTLGFFLAVISVGSLLRRVSGRSLLFAAGSLSLLFLCKMSAVIIIPFAAALLIAGLFAGRPARLRFRGKTFFFKPRPAGFAIRAAALCAAFMCVWAALWAAYGFRYKMSDGPPELSRKELSIGWITEGMQGAVPAAIKLAAEARLLPEAYLYGFAHAFKNSEKRVSFFNGKLSEKGSLWFFPFLFLVKTPAPILLALAAGLVITVTSPRRHIPVFLPFIVFSAVFVFFLLRSGLNIGFRHAMPALPAALLFCAPALKYLLRAKIRAAGVIPFLLALWVIFDCLAIYPHFLACFNPLFGGPSRAYRHVVDSSLDWGQDLENIGGEFRRRGIDPEKERVYLSYFGSAPVSLTGFPVTLLPCFMEQFQDHVSFLEPGLYCVSATMLQGTGTQDSLQKLEPSRGCAELENVYLETAAAQSGKGDIEALIRKHGHKELLEKLRTFEILRFERLRKYLLKREPDFTVGHSMHVYRLSGEDIRRALER
jgi:hypothetical protein